MIIERQIELLIVSIILSKLKHDRLNNVIEFNGKQYDNNKLRGRWNTLIEEFLEPYVIDSNTRV